MSDLTQEQLDNLRANIDAAVSARVKEALEAQSWKPVFIGAAKSGLVWLGLLAIALPELINQLAPLIQSSVPEAVYQWILRIGGIAVVVRRFVTDKSLYEKGIQ